MLDGINWQTLYFLLFATFACGFALAVVLSSNVVRMAFYLILSLGATAGLFFLAGADFVGSMQLLIYVGGTLVLLVFGVMLTAQGPFITMKTRGGEWILAAIVGGSLFLVLAQRALSVDDWLGAGQTAATTPTEAQEGGAGRASQSTALLAAHRQHEEETSEAEGVSSAPVDYRTATRIGMALSGPRVDALDTPDSTKRRGMSSYLLPFEIVSLHLLVVLVGAAYLARTKRRRLAVED